MGGGLMQLVAYGAQDIYLTGNPQITFFKVVYRRHTNFSMESIEQTLDGSVGFNSRVTSTISRNGDLVMNAYIEWSPAAVCADLQNVEYLSGDGTTFKHRHSGSFTTYAGNALVKDVELQIGGQKIDKFDRRWMSVWSDLTNGNHVSPGDLHPNRGEMFTGSTNDTLALKNQPDQKHFGNYSDHTYSTTLSGSNFTEHPTGGVGSDVPRISSNWRGTAVRSSDAHDTSDQQSKVNADQDVSGAAQTRTWWGQLVIETSLTLASDAAGHFFTSASSSRSAFGGAAGVDTPILCNVHNYHALEGNFHTGDTAGSSTGRPNSSGFALKADAAAAQSDVNLLVGKKCENKLGNLSRAQLTTGNGSLYAICAGTNNSSLYNHMRISTDNTAGPVSLTACGLYGTDWCHLSDRVATGNLEKARAKFNTLVVEPTTSNDGLTVGRLFGYPTQAANSDNWVIVKTTGIAVDSVGFGAADAFTTSPGDARHATASCEVYWLCRVDHRNMSTDINTCVAFWTDKTSGTGDRNDLFTQHDATTGTGVTSAANHNLHLKYGFNMTNPGCPSAAIRPLTPLVGSKNVSPPPAWNRKSFNVNSAPSGVWPVQVKKACVDLPFWFTKNPGLALPLIALQYHEVKMVINTADEKDMFGDNFGVMGPHTSNKMKLDSNDFKLWVDYVYLDTDERRRFAQVSHEYLIEQLQTYEQQFSSVLSSASIPLNFNHPVKELVFGTDAYTNSVSHGGIGAGLFMNAPGGLLDSRSETTQITIKLNGHERFAPRHPTYFSQQQVQKHHSGMGGLAVKDSINVYSFALKPEEHQPSGTCNFSRIDNAQLVITNAVSGISNVNETNNTPLVYHEGVNNARSLKGYGNKTQNIVIYAVNYNVLRIMSGMGGLAYSN